jgi:hypothetical protein
MFPDIKSSDSENIWTLPTPLPFSVLPTAAGCEYIPTLVVYMQVLELPYPEEISFAD